MNITLDERIEERVKHCFEASIGIKIAAVDRLSPEIAKAGLRLVNTLLNGGTLFLCGIGGSAANCAHFSSILLNSYEVERPALPVINLGTDVPALKEASQEQAITQGFARQIQALGRENDVLLILTTSGQWNSLLTAVSAAHEKGLDVIVLNGFDGGVLSSHLGPDDLELNAPEGNNVLIREVHLTILHCFCDIIEQSLFGPLLT